MNDHGKQIQAGVYLSSPLPKLTLVMCVLLLLSACRFSVGDLLMPGISASTPPSRVIATPTQGSVTTTPIPILTYYYIWFDTTSWDSNKIDYPLLGHYSSDDPAVMRQHIQWAKTAGITGFIVSWKSAPTLNRRLEQLIQIAQEENFKLAINYEGLNYQRDPLPVSQIAGDLDYFISNYATCTVFKIFEKPLIIWAGTWKFSPGDVASVTQGRRDHLLILSSERDVAGIQRLDGSVDGDAYYFSSVNPDTFPNYLQKLTSMGQTIHTKGDLWIAPAAPGFDSRLLGGTTIVDRKDGGTLWTEMNAALQSSPDAIGLISWNEFSENSYIEPSINYNKRYLDVITEINHATPPVINNFDSSEPGTTLKGLTINQEVALGLLVALVVAGLIVIVRRQMPHKG